MDLWNHIKMGLAPAQSLECHELVGFQKMVPRLEKWHHTCTWNPAALGVKTSHNEVHSPCARSLKSDETTQGILKANDAPKNPETGL